MKFGVFGWFSGAHLIAGVMHLEQGIVLVEASSPVTKISPAVRSSKGYRLASGISKLEVSLLSLSTNPQASV